MIAIDFQTLFARSPNPYVVLDAQLRLVWMNEAYLRATMREREAIIGRTMFDAFPSDPASESHALLRESFERVLASGTSDEIALIRYDIANPDGTMDTRYWSATHTPILDSEGSVAYILQHTVDVTELHGLRRLRDEVGLVRRAGAVQERNRQIGQEALRLRSLVEQAPGFVAILTGEDHRFQIANRAFRHLVGHREVIGRTVAEALPEIGAQGFVDLLDQVRSTGGPYVARAAPVVLENVAGEPGEERRLDFIYQPIFLPGEGDSPAGIYVQGYDVTEQYLAEERQQLLINELNHRVKNTLAVVQSLAGQSFRQVPGSEAAQRSFDARLGALAAAHSLLTDGNWKSARLVDMMRATISATAGAAIDRFAISGPDFTLQPQAAVSLALVLHELSTNALKYGALRVEDGSVRLTWAIEEEGDHCRLRIEWTEHNGPPVRPPAHRGFGTRLIERGMATERDSSVSIRFEPDGLRCSISAMLARQPD